MASPPAKRNAAGQQLPWVPTKDDREKAERMSGLGMPHKMICAVLGVSEPTLEKHLKEELLRGKAVATMEVAKTLFDVATKDKVPSALMFWMKCQAGWREVQRHEVTGEDGGPIQIQAITYSWAEDKPKGPTIDGEAEETE